MSIRHDRHGLSYFGWLGGFLPKGVLPCRAPVQQEATPILENGKSRKNHQADIPLITSP